MVHSMLLKNVSGQSFKVKIRTFGTSLVKYSVMNTRIGFWQIAENQFKLMQGDLNWELTPYLLIITNRYYENESVMYKELRTLRGYFSPPIRLKNKKLFFTNFFPLAQV